MRLEGPGFFLRLLKPSDAPAVLDLIARDRGRIEEFGTVPARSFMTVAAQREEIERRNELTEDGTDFLFGIFLEEGERLIGRIGLHNVMRGPFQTAIVGYHVDGSETRRGVATEALRLILGHAFATLGLHRVEAGVMPRNTASVRVLEKNGFRWEGAARAFMEIGGEWEDHWLFAVTREEWPQVVPRPSLQASYSIRPATPDDVDSLVELRLGLLTEHAHVPEQSREELSRATAGFFREGLASGEFLGWVAEAEGRVVSAVGMIYVQKPPSADNLGGLEAYLMNVFTIPEWRGAGIATALMREVLAFVRTTAVGRVRLHTADSARSIYRRLGFDPINFEMRLVVGRDPGGDPGPGPA
jgi:ribosomal-protein-alanine N-acetyltransferase